MDQLQPPSRPARLMLVGAGRVGTAVTYLLQHAGYPVVGVASRSEVSARAAAVRLSAPVLSFADDGWPETDIVLLGVPDDAIAEVGRSVTARTRGPLVVVHLAGSLGTSPLRELTAVGHGVAALHPVQACPDVDTAIRRIPGSAWGVTCTTGLEEWAQAMVVDDLRGAPVAVPEEARPLWHAASVMTSNGIAALIAFGEELLMAAGIPSDAVVLGPLAAGTVQNAREGGGGAATLTGPIVRGDVGTIERHLDALGAASPMLKEHYRLVARVILAAARSEGRVNDDRAAGITAMLER